MLPRILVEHNRDIFLGTIFVLEISSLISGKSPSVNTRLNEE